MPPSAAPVRPPQRPDLEALLLAAVQDRQQQRCLRLIEQWVHRRGLASLAHFRAAVLPGRADAEAVRWLQTLLAAEAGDPSPEPGALSPGSLGSAGLPDAAAGGSGMPTPQPAASDPEALPFPLKPDRGAALRAKAEAAVDAAFAALAETFPESLNPAPGQPSPPAPTLAKVPLPAVRAGASALGGIAVVPSGDAMAVAPAVVPVVAAAPVLTEEVAAAPVSGDAPVADLDLSGPGLAGLDPVAPLPAPSQPAAEPIIREGEDSAASQIAGQAQPDQDPAAPLGESAAPVGAGSAPAGTVQALSASGTSGAPGAPDATAADGIPQESTALAATLAEASPPELNPAESSAWDPMPGEGSQPAADLQTEAADPLVEAAASPTVPVGSGVRALLSRMRGGIGRRGARGLSHLRTLMQDCIDETVSLLRAPADDTATPGPAGTALSAGDRSGGLDGAPTVPETTALDPWSAVPSSATSSPAPLPAAGLERAALRSPQPALSPNAPFAAAGAAPGGKPQRPAAPGFRMPQQLLERRGDTAARPAPAPAALSELRSWLPDADDVPRAS